MKNFLYLLLIVLIISACSVLQESPQTDLNAFTSTEVMATLERAKAEFEQTLNPISSLLSTATARPTSTPNPTNPPKPSPTINPYKFLPGTHLVNSDLQPGIYQGKAGTGMWDSCYWERLSDLSGDFDAIIANENSEGNFYIEIKETDYALTVRCPITLIEGIDVPESFLTSLEPGMYIIGRDIQAGTYKGQAGDDFMDSCYWERMRSVTGNFSDIIANDNAIGQYYIQVSPSDFALKIRCPVEWVSN